jgi:2-dehydro-3-deoxyphosphogluconate aldolase / (4S)-4-hydroxy-2-oxoglutarate aldolase
MNIDEILAQSPIVPVIVIEHIEQAVPLARALVEGGLPVLEVTLRSSVAMQAIREISRSVSGAIVGVGTVTRPEQFRESLDAGACFAVSPGLTDSLLAASRQVDIPWLPGVFSPSEAMHAHEQGFNALKLFPAKQAGGIGMLKAMNGPLPDLLFCPTGGIDAENFIDFLSLPNVICAGGSWVCPASAIQNHDWDRIRQLAQDVHRVIEQVQ